MRLGVSYNFFNGEEHLVPSLRSLRDAVDHVSIVAQRTSNAGEAISPEALDAISDARRFKLADDILFAEPIRSRERRWNERRKRRIGLRLAWRRRCTHFFTMDADEFYRSDEVATARQLLVEGRFNSSSACSYLHVRRPTLRALDTTNVAFITKIDLTTRLKGGSYPAPEVDSTRRISIRRRRHIHFGPEVVAMYHMNLVRRDLAGKMKNSSTTDAAFLSEVAAAVAAWDGGDRFFFPRKGDLEVTNVPNEFATFDPGP